MMSIPAYITTVLVIIVVFGVILEVVLRHLGEQASINDEMVVILFRRLSKYEDVDLKEVHLEAWIMTHKTRGARNEPTRHQEP